LAVGFLAFGAAAFLGAADFFEVFLAEVCERAE
jgi:hypothetical protein